MADNYHHPGLGAFKGHIPICPRPLAGSEHQANAQLDAPGYPNAVSMQTPVIEPVPKDLRTTCEPCRLLHRTCRGGSPTKPCDRCVERKVVCAFRPLGSFVEKRKRKRKHNSTTGEEPEAVPKKVAKNGTVSAPGFDPLALDLRLRCNYCHLRARSCINGSNTTPCDNCKQRNLICTFGPRKSLVDKETFQTITDEDHTQEHNMRKTTDEDYTQEHNLSKITGENYYQEHNLDKTTGENYYHVYNDAAVARPFDVKEQQQVEVEEVEVSEPKVGMFMVRGNDGQDISFTQEDLHVEDEHLMHPWEILAARNKLVYDLYGLQYESTNVEMDQE